METFDMKMSLQYIGSLAPEYTKDAERILLSLPPDWHVYVPRFTCHDNANVSKQAVAHAVLFILAPEKFPGSRRTRLLAAYMKRFLEGR